jgi:hypothetical protein
LDEVGHADLKASEDPNQRYLSLTGVICGLTYYTDTVVPRINTVKREAFGCEGVVLHRTDIVRATGPPFDVLRDAAARERFDRATLAAISDLEYTVITVTIDKLEHVRRYRVWQAHPYHYCMECLIERYVKWLEKGRHVGDILAEARGKKEDKKLKATYAHLFNRGTRFVDSARIRRPLSSHELKLSPKCANVNGLQLADLLAHPSFRHSWAIATGAQMNAQFGTQVARILEEEKYDRSPSGATQNYGRKWLP